jgi:adenylate cyclase
MLFAYYYSKADVDSARRVAKRTVEQVEKVLAANPDNGAALAFGAMALATGGDVDRARDWIERCLLVDPDNLQMRYNLAWGFNKVLNDQEAALDMLRPVFGRREQTSSASPRTIRTSTICAPIAAFRR